jgi:hypothetical protein
LKAFVPVVIQAEMKQTEIRTIFTLFILVGTVCLTTGVDRCLHILVCHHQSHSHTELPGEKPSHHSDSDEQHCSVCQFFACGCYQTLPQTLEVIINPAAALWGMPENTITLVTKTVYDKTSRAPPFAC